MCFGGGGKDPYDAYKSGDFASWKSGFDRKAKIQQDMASGKITEAAGQKQINALVNGTPGTLQHVTETVPSTVHHVGGRGGDYVGDPATTRQVDKMVGGVPGINIDAMGNKIKEDPSANMEMREVVRQNDVNLGRTGIDKAFGQFNPKYYDKYKTDYQSYYTPELDKQHADAIDKLTAVMADRGMLASTVGNAKFGDLQKENLDARTNIANEANDASKKLKGTVENSKTNMYNLNEASANPQAVNAQAVGQATALVAPPTYSPLGKVFADFLGGLSNFQNARSNTPTRQYSSPYSNPTGYGSGRVVG